MGKFVRQIGRSFGQRNGISMYKWCVRSPKSVYEWSRVRRDLSDEVVSRIKDQLISSICARRRRNDCASWRNCVEFDRIEQLSICEVVFEKVEKSVFISKSHTPIFVLFYSFAIHHPRLWEQKKTVYYEEKPKTKLFFIINSRYINKKFFRSKFSSKNFRM